MKKEYRIIKALKDPDLNDKEWEKAEKQQLDFFFNPQAQNPYVTVQSIYTKNGITVKYESDEINPTVNYWTANQPAWLDSCVEFFFAPDADSPFNYLNFEQSVAGALLIQKGTQDDRHYIPHTDEEFQIQKEISDSGWKIKFFVPFEFVKQHYSKFDREFKGNFQFCNEDKNVYITWNKIESSFPAFHRPTYFANIELLK